MFKGKKCSSCNGKIKESFSYCPSCGKSFKQVDDSKDFGMLGKTDSIHNLTEGLNLPLGLGKMVNSLVKQLEKQMNSMDLENCSGNPRGFKIKVSTGTPQTRQVIQNSPENVEISNKISNKESERRMKLEKIDAESKIRRLGDRIIYEIETSGIKSKEDVVLTKLATGIEVKAYSKDKCYVKFIPLTLEIVGYFIKQNKVFVELKA